MNRYIRFVCIILSLALLLATPAYAVSNSPEITPYSSAFFQRYSLYLSRYSSTLFYICFNVTATGQMTELGASSIEVQRSPDGISNWTTTKTYTPDSHPTMMDDYTGTHGTSLLYGGTAGYYYRAYVTFYAKNSSGSAKYFAYTDVLKL